MPLLIDVAASLDCALAPDTDASGSTKAAHSFKDRAFIFRPFHRLETTLLELLKEL